MILDKLAAASKRRVEKLKSEMPIEEIKKMAFSCEITEEFPFYENLKNDEMSFICEVKKASPSKGLITHNFPYVQIAKEYEAAGAAAISILTEPEYFLGSDIYLSEIAENVKIPILRKDFTVDPYQIYEAKIMGASSVLLICSILTKQEVREYREIANALGICALVEAHDEYEIETALDTGAFIIGVNNRNLQDFTVDINTTLSLRKLVPDDKVFVSESGIETPEDITLLRENKVDAVLIGETLMRSDDKKKMLNHLRGNKNV